MGLVLVGVVLSYRYHGMTNPKKDECIIGGHYGVVSAYALIVALYILDIH